MKKLMMMLLCGAMIISSAWAQTARSVIEKTAKILAAYPSCSAHFNAAMGAQGGMSGTITIQGNRFVVNSSEASVWFDGKTMWTHVKKTNEVNVTTPTAQELQRMNPYHFLNLYKTGYDLSLSQSGNVDVVKMTSQRKQGIKIMEVAIDKATKLPSRVQMTSQRGTVSTISISNIKKGKKMSDTYFRFNPKDNPKAQIIDLR